MILASACHLHPEDHCLVGVSGGADSICLLHAMHTLGYSLVAVHVNHHLRPEADQEAITVERSVNSMGLEFISCDIDVIPYAEEHGLSIEEAARDMRYACLFKQADKSAAKAVLVAHNADDQAETILMHFLRGSGLTGMRGMEYYSLPNPWSNQIPIVRPLLSTTREEIVSYLNNHQLSFITDPSNYDQGYLRNRIRYELLPFLESYNPRIRDNLLRMGQISREDYALLQDLVTQTWESILLKQGKGYLAFQLSGFRQSPAAVQRYLLRKAIGFHLPSMRDIDFDSIQRGIEFLCGSQSHSQVDLIAGLRLLKEEDTFWLATWQADLPGTDFPSIPVGAGLALKIPSNHRLEGEWVLQAVEEADPKEAIQHSELNKDPFQAWFAIEDLELPLIIRSRASGERFQPLGMGGHSMKISDLMINLKIPLRGRSTWPLVCAGTDVIWVPGCRQSMLGRVQPGSRRIAHLTLRKGSGA